jgi:prepilin-type N-terminal cleavage/methylation domain-containing protein
MPISTQKTSKFLNDQGFSLLEILVALLLAALIFVAIPSSENSRRHQDLQTAIDDVDRSVRFAASEAVLRNTVVRLRIDLEKSPTEYFVEYGPSENLILPAMQDETEKDLKEIEEEKKQLAKLDSQFTKVEEFEDITREFPGEVTFMGAMTTFQKKLIREQPVSIYFYPTGERDGALLFFSTQDELATLEILPFQERTEDDYYPAPPPQEGEDVGKVDDFLENKMEEIAKNWLEK